MSGSMQEKVAAFHRKHGFPAGIRPGDDPKTDLVRAHLIAEELGELIEAQANRDRAKIADAVADLLYVVVGAAVTYGIPAELVFDEVHRSNMTKAVRDPADTRLRNKGASYDPPNVAAVLDAYDDARKAIDEAGDPPHPTAPGTAYDRFQKLDDAYDFRTYE